MKNQGNQHVTSVTSRFNRLTPIAWACGSLLLGMGQVHAALLPPVFAAVGSYDKTECVADTANNLIWEGKTADGSARDRSKPYTNYDSNSTGGTDINVATNSIGYVKVVNDSNLCGFNDWRMPTIDELMTLVKTGSSPTIDTTWFPNARAYNIWSGSPNASSAWYVYFGYGISNYSLRGNGYGVWLVRGGQSSAPSTPTPPITPKAVNDGIVGNTVGTGAEVLQVCQTTLYAGSNGATVRATGTSGMIDVAVQNGSINIPCPAANPFCTTAQNQVTALTDETIRFGNNCEVSQIQVTPPTPTTSPARLNGQSLIDSVIAVVLANAPSIGVETVRKANQWNALQLGFSTGTASVQAQSPMLVNPNLPDGVTVLPNGTVRVVTKGVIVNFAPALLDTSRFTDVLQTGLPTAQMRTNADGTLVIGYNGALYALRPNMETTATNTSRFTTDSSGNLRFDNQGLAPAVYNFDQFAAIIKEALPTATVQTQLNGTGITVTLNGTTYTLKPDYRVQLNDGSSTSNIEVRNGKVFVNYPFGFTQGFAVQ